MALRHFPVPLIHLLIKRAEIVEPAEAEEAAGEEPEDAGGDFPEIEAVDPEEAEEKLEQPSDGVVVSAACVSSRRLFFHGGNEEKIDDPADEQQAAGEQPDDPSDGLPEIEAVDPDETEDPHEVSEAGAVGLLFLC